jgi:hypothetical protein
MAQSGIARAQLPRTASGANAAAIQATVDQFRADLGGANNGAGGTFATGRREINWDAVPDALATPAALPGAFFNTTSLRGAVFTTAGTGFTVSQDDDTGGDADADQVRFSNLLPAYAAEFDTFSPQRLFAVTGSVSTDVTFFVPGTATQATVKGFGVVFTDVDQAIGTQIELFDVNGNSLGAYVAPVGKLSFVGVSYPTAYTIGSVRITSGNAVLGLPDGASDIVVMDDFIYGEPQPPSFEFFPATINLPENPAGVTPVTIFRRGFTTTAGSVNVFAQEFPTQTAVQASDFQIGPFAFNFNVGEVSKQLSITIFDDPFAEGLELVRLRLSNPSAGHALAPTHTQVLGIEDDEFGPAGVYAATTDNLLVAYTLTNAGTISSTAPITGLQAEERIVGLDHRPADGLLYGLGSTSRLYRITPGAVTATAVEVGAGPFAPPLGLGRFGFDFDPISDRIRVVTSTGVNFRLNPADGTVAGGAVDTPLAYVAGDVNEGIAPDIASAGYLNSYPGATETGLYALDAATDSLVLVNQPENGGLLTTIGPVGVDIADASLDVQQGTNYAYASITTPLGGDATYLYLIDLQTGGGYLLAVIGISTPPSHDYTSFTIVPAGILRFTGAPAQTVEGGIAQLMVERVGGSAGAISTVGAEHVGGTATLDVDFLTNYPPVNFADGEVGPKPFLMTTIDDAIQEPTETMTLGLIGAPSSVTRIFSQGMVSILDNEQPLISITDVAIAEGQFGTTNAVFTVSLSAPSAASVTVDYGTADGSAVAFSDYQSRNGTLTFDPNVQVQQIVVPVIGDVFPEGVSENFRVNLANAQGAAIADVQAVGTITDDDGQPTYYFAEGATGSFFDLDLAIANPNATEANIILTFLQEGGAPPLTFPRVLSPQSRTTIRVDDLPGLEAQFGIGVLVTSVDNLPLAVDRLMTWDDVAYGGHSARATNAPNTDWFFAEGVQNGTEPQSGAPPFFDTFVLIANPQNATVQTTVTFLLEPSGTVSRNYDLAPNSRLTIYAGGIPEVVGHAFAIRVHATQPVLAERSTYFGAARLWDGGHGSSGVPAASASWSLAEGATGPFFETFLAMANPNGADAHVQIEYLRASGPPIVKNKVISPDARLTVNIEADDPDLANEAVSSVITSDVPIVVERMMYWPDPFASWYEAHSSFGLTEPGIAWGVAEGRVGQAANYQTYVLVANANSEPANITATFFRTAGAPIEKPFVVNPRSRFNLHVNTLVPELANESFSTRIAVTNGQPIFVESAIYWDALGVTWAGGTSTVGTRLP